MRTNKISKRRTIESGYHRTYQHVNANNKHTIKQCFPLPPLLVGKEANRSRNDGKYAGSQQGY